MNIHRQPCQTGINKKNDEANLQTLKWGLIRNTSSEVFPDFLDIAVC